MTEKEFENKVVKPLFVTAALLKDYSVIEIQKELKNRELEQNVTEIKDTKEQ